MSSSSSADPLTAYLAGELSAEQLVAAVTAAYYGNGAQGLGPGGRLKPLMEMIERAHPGVVELSGSAEKPGFGVRLAERPFPKRYEGELREAVQRIVGDPSISIPPTRGILSRFVAAIRKIFSA